jgi:hypothetical protein
VDLQVTLWFFAAIISFGVVNLLIAAVVLRRRERVSGVSAHPILDVLAFALIDVVLMAAMIVDVLLIIPSAPAIGRPALFVVGALTFEALRRTFALLPNAPLWPLRVLRLLEIVLLALAVVGILLGVVIQRV